MTAHSAPFNVTPVQKKYLEQQLDKVSRSFAILIPYLEPPLRYYLGTAYLLCRVADNIEDCSQPLGWKQERFDELTRLLLEPQVAAMQLAQWERQPWPGLNDDERQLMATRSGLTLWQLYAAIPASSQAIIRRWVCTMVHGMRHLGVAETRPRFVQRNGIDLLDAEVDYNAYCYYVAGTVGQLASELVVEQYGLAPDVASVLHERAESCGRSLQKTNIIKDFVADLARNICYLPDTWMNRADYTPLHLRGARREWTALVLGDALEDLRNATDYVLALPHAARGYRRASLLCLLPAYHTMLLAARRADELFTSAHQIKISRTTIAQCVSDMDKIVADNDAIQEYGARMEGSIRAGVGLHGTPRLA